MEKRERETWSDLEIRTKIAYISAIAAFVLGWGLTVASFIVPPLGAVADSVLWILGQALVYAASVFGVALYTVNSVRSMKRDVRDFLRDEDRRFHHNDNLIVEQDEDYPDSEI